MHARIVLSALGLLFTGQAMAELDPGVEAAVSASLVKVRVVNETRRVATGSAVSVNKGVLVTSCHGLRQARVIQILADELQFTVTKVTKDVEHDLCLLATSETIPPLPLATAEDDLKVGDPVAAFGFSGPEVHYSQGTVKALHWYHGSLVIQTDAVFTSGESGGALIDRHGRLVGILTFYAHGRRDFHFAVPVSWVRDLLALHAANAPLGRQPDLSFWERTDGDRPAFLEAAAREYAQDWTGLKDVASRWIRREPHNAQAWIALGKATHHSRQDTAAVSALEEALKLDSQQPAAWYYLGAAYRELNESEGLQKVLNELEQLSPDAARALRDGVPLN